MSSASARNSTCWTCLTLMTFWKAEQQNGGLYMSFNREMVWGWNGKLTLIPPSNPNPNPLIATHGEVLWAPLLSRPCEFPRQKDQN